MYLQNRGLVFQLLIILVIQLPSVAKPQGNTSLSRYYYPLVSYHRWSDPTHPKSRMIEAGSCFFYHKGKKTFAITNYHLITGWNCFSGQRDYEVDSTQILVTIPGTQRIKPLPYKFSGPLSKFSFLDKVDLFSIELNISPDLKINYINDLLDPSYVAKTPVAIKEYRFPLQNNRVRVDSTVELNGKVIGNQDSVINRFSETSNFKAISMNKDAFKRAYCLSTPASSPGWSGAAIFGRFRSKSGTVYRLIGVDFGGADELNLNFIINLKSVLDFLNGLPE